MIEIYDKLSTHGIILEGNFNINPLTKIPNNYYAGKSIDGTNLIQGVSPIPTASYLVIDNHHLIKIMTGSELTSYKSIGANVQCIEGERLMTNGEYVQFDEDKNNTGMIVIAIDENKNTLIIYHQSINKYNMISLLLFFKIKDAIVICETDNSHIIWKECGIDYYNKTDFIGNANEIVSNVLTFSS
jgi:Cu/Ag efflux protein CusF